MLVQQTRRLKRCASLDEIVVATTTNSTDNPVVAVRITSDCPLIDPGSVDEVVDELVKHEGECDYAANCLERSYPRGLDAEAFFVDVLAHKPPWPIRVRA
jgi:spore coat polysaccharide biosynthesis protein SpsF